jgi:hypothetical protein
MLKLVEELSLGKNKEDLEFFPLVLIDRFYLDQSW